MADDGFNPLSLITAPVNGLFSWMGAGKQADAAKQAATLQTTAATHAADLQSQSAAQALAFQKQSAAQDQANFNSTQQANYNQWLPREQQLSSLGSLVGLPARNIPAYQPTANLLSSQTVPSQGQTATGQKPTGNLTDPNAWMSLVSNKPALTQWVQSQGITDPGLAGYYVEKIQGQPGANPTEQAGSAAYWSQKIQSDPSLGGSSGASSVQKTAAPTALGSYIGGQMDSVPITPALQMPGAFQTRSLSSMIGR